MRLVIFYKIAAINGTFFNAYDQNDLQPMGSIINKELAEITLELGLVKAMNLDGGASSGLYYEGKYITSPGRQLSNALVIVHHIPTPSVKVNDDEVFFKAEPFVENGKMMIPVRGLFESLRATVSWNSENRQITITQLEKIIELLVGKKETKVDDQTLH